MKDYNISSWGCRVHGLSFKACLFFVSLSLAFAVAPCHVAAQADVGVIQWMGGGSYFGASGSTMWTAVKAAVTNPEYYAAATWVASGLTVSNAALVGRYALMGAGLAAVGAGAYWLASHNFYLDEVSGLIMGPGSDYFSTNYPNVQTYDWSHNGLSSWVYFGQTYHCAAVIQLTPEICGFQDSVGGAIWTVGGWANAYFDYYCKANSQSTTLFLRIRSGYVSQATPHQPTGQEVPPGVIESTLIDDLSGTNGPAAVTAAQDVCEDGCGILDDPYNDWKDTGSPPAALPGIDATGWGAIDDALIGGVATDTIDQILAQDTIENAGQTTVDAASAGDVVVNVNIPVPLPVIVENPTTTAQIAEGVEQGVTDALGENPPPDLDPGPWDDGFILPDADEKRDLPGILSTFKDGLENLSIYRMISDFEIDTSSMSSNLCVNYWKQDIQCVDLAQYGDTLDKIGNVLKWVCMLGGLLFFLL